MATAAWRIPGHSAPASSASWPATWRCRSTTSATAGATTPASSTSTKARSIRRPAGSRGLASTCSIPTASWCRPRRATRRSSSSTRSRRRSSGRRSTPTFNSLEVGLEKRYSNRWSGRVSYTLAHCYDVAAPIIVDSNPRLDYGRCDRDNVHAFATSAQRGYRGRVWARGFVFRAYSGYPINETVGSDVNGDGTNNDRPTQGRQRLGPAAVRTARHDRVGGRFAGRRGPQRDRRREESDPRRTRAVHPPDRPVSGRALPGDLQPDESRQLRQSDRGEELGQFPEGRSWPTIRGPRSSASA